MKTSPQLAWGFDYRELHRLEWRVGDPGDPAALLEDYLAAFGLPARDLTALTKQWNDPGRVSVTASEDPITSESGVCGAALLISAAGGAAMLGASTGAATPTPGVPDLVAVVHEVVPAPAASLGQQSAGLWVGPWTGSWSARDHAGAIEAVRHAILRGDVYQANVVGHSSAPYDGDPTAALDAVAALPGATWAGRLEGDGWAVASGSPECLVSVSDGRIETRPIKGTRPRTARGRRELAASSKEKAEHVMIVDLERNDLAQLAETGSVVVDELFAVRAWCDLWQAESVVSARLRSGVGLAALLRAVCPGGSVTGAPKRAALELLSGLEPVGRGPAMGALGYLGPDCLTLGLTIRTVAAAGGRLHLWAGGGITWPSESHAEVAEAAAKAAPLRAAIRTASSSAR